MGWVGRLGGDAEMPCRGGWGRGGADSREGGADSREGGSDSGGLGSARWGKVERTVVKTQAAGSGVGAGLSVDGEGRGAE